MPTGSFPYRSIADVPAAVAYRLGGLSVTPASWIHRRVEHVQYLDRGTTSRRLSIDFDIPPLRSEETDPVPFVPVAQFRKSNLVNFDLTAGDGSALPMLTTEQNGILSAAMLTAVARAECPELLDSVAERHIERLVFAVSDRAKDESLRRILPPHVDVDDHPSRQAFRGLTADLADNFVLYIDIRHWAARSRQLVKVAYEQSEPVPRPSRPWQWLGWAPAQDALALPMAGYGRSLHVELDAPEEMAFTGGDLVVIEDGHVASKARASGGRRMHLQCTGLTRAPTAALVRLRARSGLLSGAATAATINFAVLLFVRVRVEHFGAPSNGEAAVAAMLAVPGLLVGYIARPTEHEVLSTFLVGVRVVALVSSATSFAAALALFAGFGDGLAGVLTALVVVAGVCSFMVGVSWWRQRR